MPTAYQATARGVVDVERKNARKAIDNARSAVISDVISVAFILDFKSEIKTTSQKCYVWVVAQLAEHRTVTAAREGSTPFDPPKRCAIFDWRLPIDRN